jgi:hypothetical protein
MSFAQRLSSRDNSLSNLSGSGSRRTLRGSGKTRTPQPEPRRDSGQQSESSSERRLSFFRSLFERRKNDYHADVQVGNAFQRGLRYADRTVGAATTVERSSPPPEMLDEEKPSCFSCLRPSQPILDTMSCTIEARLWEVIIFLNTLLVLFGSEIQDLCIPTGGDAIMDVFYTIAMAVFFFDMVMRCFLEPKYMPWCGCAESKCILVTHMCTGRQIGRNQ